MIEMMLVTAPIVKKTLVFGQMEFTIPSTTSATIPEGVYSISAETIGAGGKFIYGSGWAVPGGAGGGGGRAWSNNIPVTPGETLTIIVPAAGSEGNCTIIRDKTGEILVQAESGANGTQVLGGRGGRGMVGDRLTNGGRGGFRAKDVTYYCGGGGAAGYTGNGGNGYTVALSSTGTYYEIRSYPTAGAGGGGGGGGSTSLPSGNVSTHGGGAGIYGEGANGQTGFPGKEGSKKTNSKTFGGGGGYNLASGQGGAARIIWGEGRAYPNTGTSDY